MKLLPPVFSFQPVCGPSAKVLILGSMPGIASLKAKQYYAHPRNSFWVILGKIVGFDAGEPYGVRIEALRNSAFALWDVLHSCVRPGSLDSNIEAGTRTPNDFEPFFTAHPTIELVCFNGAEAEKSFQRQVSPSLKLNALRFVRLPSTSPAYAALTVERKTAIWQAVLGPFGRT